MKRIIFMMLLLQGDLLGEMDCWSKEWSLLNEKIVSTKESHYAGYPSLSCAEKRCLLAWEEEREEAYGIWYSQSLDGSSTWTVAKKISPRNYIARYPKGTIWPDGRMLVTWIGGKKKEKGKVFLYSQDKKKFASTWNNPFLILGSHAVKNQDLERAEEEAAVVYDAYNGEFGIHFRKWDGKWNEAKRLSGKHELLPQIRPSLAINGERIAVVWQDLQRDLTPLKRPYPDNWRVAVRTSFSGGRVWGDIVYPSGEQPFSFHPVALWIDKSKLALFWKHRDQRMSWNYFRTFLVGLEKEEAIQREALFSIEKTEGRISPPLFAEGLQMRKTDRGIFGCFFTPESADAAFRLYCNSIGNNEDLETLVIGETFFVGFPSFTFVKRDLLLAFQEMRAGSKKMEIRITKWKSE